MYTESIIMNSRNTGQQGNKAIINIIMIIIPFLQPIILIKDNKQLSRGHCRYRFRFVLSIIHDLVQILPLDYDQCYAVSSFLQGPSSF